MSHRVPRAVAAVALALFVAGCSSTAATPTAAPVTPAPTAAPITVVMIPKQVNNPYFDVAFKGAQQAATDLGGAVSQVGPSAADATQQIPFIQTATTQKASAILVSADDATAIAPALQAAMAAGIKVVGYDSSPAKGAYNVFVNQADTAGIGKGLADMACDEAPSCTGEIAVLSAAQTATNQNAWIDAMKTTLKDAKYSKLVFDGVVYGNDDPAVSTTQAQALLTAHPNLKVIVAPTTVGIVAAAQVVKAQNKTGQVFVTGLGTPKGMVDFVKGGQAPEFALWNVTDLGYLAYAVAVDLLNGTIKGNVGDTFTVKFADGTVNYTIGADSIVVLGPPFVFNAQNIDQYVTSFGF
ncbi:MAG: substrate-binding domain-containing protein [Candidatus Limnocylindrales bacterium]|jgi:rhamnose transport system substrate-binding protein